MQLHHSRHGRRSGPLRSRLSVAGLAAPLAAAAALHAADSCARSHVFIRASRKRLRFFRGHEHRQLT